jgi:hypothetical protein
VLFRRAQALEASGASQFPDWKFGSPPASDCAASTRARPSAWCEPISGPRWASFVRTNAPGGPAGHATRPVGQERYGRAAHNRDAVGCGDGLPDRTTRLPRRNPASRLAACRLASHWAGVRSNQTRSPVPWHSSPPSMPMAWRLIPPSCGTCHLPHRGHATARGSPGNNRTRPGGSSLARSGGLPSRSRGMSDLQARARRRSLSPAGTIATAGDRQRDALH